MIDRLTLDEHVIRGMADGLMEVAALSDPVGEIRGMWKKAQRIAGWADPDTTRRYRIYL